MEHQATPVPGQTDLVSDSLDPHEVASYCRSSPTAGQRAEQKCSQRLIAAALGHCELERLHSGGDKVMECFGSNEFRILVGLSPSPGPQHLDGSQRQRPRTRCQWPGFLRDCAPGPGQRYLPGSQRHHRHRLIVGMTGPPPRPC